MSRAQHPSQWMSLHFSKPFISQVPFIKPQQKLLTAFFECVQLAVHSEGKGKIDLCRRVHTLSCVSGRGRWRIRPPLFCRPMCARLQTQSRAPPASAQPASGRRPAQTATGAETGRGKQMSCRAALSRLPRDDSSLTQRITGTSNTKGGISDVRCVLFTGWFLEYRPWKLGWECVYRNHRRVH